MTKVDEIEYDWDDNGNLLDDGVRTYEYDYANRLVQVVSGTLTTTFTYNGDGHRVAKVENGQTTTYTIAMLGLSQVLVETSSSETTRYVYGHDLLAEKDGNAWAWHLGDGLGSVRQLTDGSGQVTLAQGYTPFGVPMWDAGSGATGYGFTGERWEAYAQLLFLRARYYEPGMGRFITKDPWEGDYEHPITINPYVYALANPANVLDPSGRQCIGCQTEGDWAEFVLYYAYGIRLTGEGCYRFFDREKVLILETVSDYANQLLSSRGAFRRNMALSTIKKDWVDLERGARSGANMIILPPWWVDEVITMRPDRNECLIIDPCWERWLEFPEGSLPTKEKAAKFVFAHEMGHSLHASNPRVLRSFKDNVDLPFSKFFASSDPNPLIARNASRSEFAQEVLADVLAAYLYSPGLLNDEMWDWVEFEMRTVLR